MYCIYFVKISILRSRQNWKLLTIIHNNKGFTESKDHMNKWRAGSYCCYAWVESCVLSVGYLWLLWTYKWKSAGLHSYLDGKRLRLICSRELRAKQCSTVCPNKRSTQAGAWPWSSHVGPWERWVLTMSGDILAKIKQSTGFSH